MPQIIGETLHGIFREADAELTTPWNALTPYDKDVFVEVAIVLNGTYLAPLQGLVRDWQELLQAQDDLSVMSLAEIEGWDKDWEALKKRTQELLQGAQPYHSTIHHCEAAEQQIAQLERENDAYKSLLLRHKGFIECTPFVTQEEWLVKSFELFSDTITLLKGEQKEK